MEVRSEKRANLVLRKAPISRLCNNGFPFIGCRCVCRNLIAPCCNIISQHCPSTPYRFDFRPIPCNSAIVVRRCVGHVFLSTVDL